MHSTDSNDGHGSRVNGVYEVTAFGMKDFVNVCGCCSGSAASSRGQFYESCKKGKNRQTQFVGPLVSPAFYINLHPSCFCSSPIILQAMFIIISILTTHISTLIVL